MSAAIQLAIQLADEIHKFPLGNCGPSDDPDKQYAFCAGFRDVAIRFIGDVKRIGDPDLSSLVATFDTSFEYISEAHELRASLYVVIDALREAMQDPSYEATQRRMVHSLVPRSCSNSKPALRIASIRQSWYAFAKS
jgi:hypothetical protein